MQELRRITMDPGVMGGKPCIRGMRVTVGMIVEAIAAGRTVDELLTDSLIFRPKTSGKRSRLPLAPSASSTQVSRSLGWGP